MARHGDGDVDAFKQYLDSVGIEWSTDYEDDVSMNHYIQVEKSAVDAELLDKAESEFGLWTAERSDRDHIWFKDAASGTHVLCLECDRDFFKMPYTSNRCPECFATNSKPYYKIEGVYPG